MTAPLVSERVLLPGIGAFAGDSKAKGFGSLATVTDDGDVARERSVVGA